MSTLGQFGTPMTEQQYAEHWGKSSTKHVHDGDYAWLLDQLPASTNVLEVGSGSGESTLALVRAGKKVLALELNAHCIEETVRKLSDKGVRVRMLPIDALAPMSLDEVEVIIVQADILDIRIDTHLRQVAVDTIVCWFIGVAPSRAAMLAKKQAEALTQVDLENYRHAVHKRCGDLGRSLLVDGTFIHIADRGGFGNGGTETLARSEALEQYENLLRRPYIVTVRQIAFRPMGLAPTDSKMTYVAPSFVTGVPLVISVLAKKSESDHQPGSPITVTTRAANIPLTDVPKVGRDQKCPCGSGKKYKKCHGQSTNN
jgi:protein-L-isoaspartate O-methyltransferase